MTDVDLRRGGRAKVLVLVLVLVSPFGYLGYRIWHGNKVNDQRREQARKEAAATPDQVAELKSLIPQLRAKLDAAAAQIKADVTREALDAAVAADGGKCPYDIAREFGLRDNLGKQLAMMDHTTPVDHSEKLPLSTDGLGTARAHLSLAAEHLADNAATKDDVAAVEQDAHDLGGALIVVGTIQRAVTVAGKYVPGHVDGDAFLYLFRAHQIVCAGHIAVTTPDSVMVEYTAAPGDTQAGDQAADAKLEAALYDAEVDALSKTLHAVR
jgi:hypothetical protein